MDQIDKAAMDDVEGRINQEEYIRMLNGRMHRAACEFQAKLFKEMREAREKCLTQSSD